MELVDVPDSKSGAARRGGSSPPRGTTDGTFNANCFPKISVGAWTNATQAQNLVQNPDFSSGDASWATGAGDCCGYANWGPAGWENGGTINSGYDFTATGAVPQSVTQTIITTIGTTYNFSFSYEFAAGGSNTSGDTSTWYGPNPAYINASIGGVPFASITQDTSSLGTNSLGHNLIATYSGKYTATQNFTLVAFSGSNENWDTAVTDVCVTPSGGSGCGAMYGVSGGAPEIDGSLAPKVGFLLGCLFLMFGRKKQNSEPMLTA